MTSIESLSAAIDALLLKGHSPAETLNDVVQTVGLSLNADRCFLYVRQPDQARGRTAFCWRKNDQVPDKNPIQPDWQPDTTDLPAEDPLIRAGLAMKPSVYVDDVETAAPDVLNRDFERKTFGHRALIHAHIQQDGQLWGILQPCMFGSSRHWTSGEKTQIEAILPRLQPIIAAYVGGVSTLGVGSTSPASIAASWRSSVAISSSVTVSMRSSNASKSVADGAFMPSKNRPT